MKTEPVPFDKFARIGIYPKDLMHMPKDLRDSILSGELSPLMRLNVPVGDNSAVSIPMKIQLVHDKDGQLQLLTYQIHRELDNNLKLNDTELERVRKGDVIQKEFKEGDNRKMRYVQLDKESNALMYRVMWRLLILRKNFGKWTESRTSDSELGKRKRSPQASRWSLKSVTRR